MGALTEFSLAKRGYNGEVPAGYISALEAHRVHGIPKKWFWREARRHTEKAVRISGVLLMTEEYIIKKYKLYHETLRRRRRSDAYDEKWSAQDHDDSDNEEHVREYYQERWERVREKAQRVLPDGRIATDFGMMYG